MSKTLEKPAPTPTEETPKPKYVKDLILLFAIPGSIALIAALAVYVPQLFAKPQSDFMYSFCDNYECNDSYSVTSDGRIRRDEIDRDPGGYYDPGGRKSNSLRYYDASENTYRVIDINEATTYTLDTNAKSPDGYTLSSARNGGGFLFWDDYRERWYLKNGSKRKQIDLTNKDSYYSDNITFLGWVKQ